ncbi:MAG: type II 3-dehydroquinate dehydratase [Limnochordia bacterium]|jgi:3-dehydroquinate dehydratase-2|nr:type II 3-dehydroquinate dehydratase [Limnochordia bacterium]MDD2629505.1 type II 3-dehydroquinate dehydratase [Limnochordia bacterium]MDD4518196.1 type II 3-dehydroquinate dehydratase [Limnochordia bacterium]
MWRILVIHGPNLNLLGVREKNVYGDTPFAAINEQIRSGAEKMGIYVEIFQSNHEGEIIDRIHAALGKFDGLIINPGAYTHYSVAIRDAVAAVDIPTIEVHLSNVSSREDFRKESVIAPVCLGQISGLGPISYLLGLSGIVMHLEASKCQKSN